MPTYSYKCTAYDHTFDAVQAFSDSALTECPECQGRLRKLYNTVGVVFKGSGFYRTDSRSSTAAAPSSAPSTDSASSGSSGGSSTGSAASSSTAPSAPTSTPTSTAKEA